MKILILVLALTSNALSVEKKKENFRKPALEISYVRTNNK